MRVHLIAVGRLRSGPEHELVRDYLTRFDRTGRGLGLTFPSDVIEVEDKTGKGSTAEAELITKAVPKGAVLCVLDERGKIYDSPGFADTLAGRRDTGTQDMAFVIGGADGLTPALRQSADMAMSFGKMVWPHMLVRVMLAEQLYRAASILAGLPYHRT